MINILKIVIRRTDLATHCNSQPINENKDIFLYIYSGDYVTDYFCKGEKRFFNIHMDKKILNKIKTLPGFTSQSYVLNLTDRPKNFKAQLLSHFFPIAKDTIWGTDEGQLIDYVRRNLLGFASHHLQVQATQLLIRYMLDKNKFLIRHCSHCWCFLTSDENHKRCIQCENLEDWPKRNPALLCFKCSSETSSKLIHEGIRGKLNKK
jgi:hypothetical protein